MTAYNPEENKGLFLEEAVRNLQEDLIRAKKRDLYKVILQVVERPLIEEVLERTFGNKIKAAKILGINRNTLYSKIKKLGIDVERFKNYY